MNKFFVLPIVPFLIFAIMSCEKKYVVSGVSNDAFLDGSRVYLKIENGDKLVAIDSCDIIHGKFRMSGDADTVRIAAFCIGDINVRPIVLEDGKISVVMGRRAITVEGTTLNDELSSFILRKETFENRMQELESIENRLILDGYSVEAASETLSDSIKTVRASVDVFIEEFIKKHYTTVLGPCVFRLLCSTLPYPCMTRQIERLVSNAPEQFLNDAFVKEFLRNVGGVKSPQ